MVLALLHRLRAAWLEILPSSELREEAMRVLRLHPLRAGDALQLSAAIVCSGPSRSGALVILDERLRLSARLEGFEVLPLKL